MKKNITARDSKIKVKMKINKYEPDGVVVYHSGNAKYILM